MVCHTFLLVLSVLEGCCRVAENYFSILKIFLFPISPHQRFKLSYLSKREASTTQKVQDVLSYSSVVIPLQTKGFYNREQRYQPWYWCWVVIPLQTKGFYNVHMLGIGTRTSGVVIPLQTKGFYNDLEKAGKYVIMSVVIPLQTKGFYNTLYMLQT